ncbi:hypothetical protein ACFXPS_43255 [Nocardia sp. NPDC059091]|uniref:hypothetical protein n=1 Tax=unclassified Nocardia TaxID=2637762 RepID=UPI0036B9B437
MKQRKPRTATPHHAVSGDELSKELAVLDQAVAAVPAGVRRSELDELSREAFVVLECRVYALDHRTALGPDRRRER